MKLLGENCIYLNCPFFFFLISINLPFFISGYDKGCSIAEFLAIDDEAFQHKRLVRFFKRAGFNVIKYVGDDLASVPDRLVWGGCGTLMNEKIEKLLLIWTKTLFRSKDN